jgi:hypothetical protein
MEIYWGLLKNELVHHSRFATRGELRPHSLNTSRCFIISSEHTRGSTCLTFLQPPSRSSSSETSLLLHPLDSTLHHP